jgi:bifunctional non-homologous end joining protein LigD
MQPTLAAAVPLAAGWVHEVKVHGWRIIARLSQHAARLTSREGRDRTEAMEPIAVAMAALRCREAIIDGEAAAPDVGRTNVEDVRHPEHLAYFAFDLLWLDGEDLRSKPLLERKRRLEMLITSGSDPRLFYVEHVSAEQGTGLYRAAVAIGCEGIVSKRAESVYSSGETQDWLKITPTEVRARQAEAVRATHAKRPKR